MYDEMQAKIRNSTNQISEIFITRHVYKIAANFQKLTDPMFLISMNPEELIFLMMFIVSDSPKYKMAARKSDNSVRLRETNLLRHDCEWWYCNSLGIYCMLLILLKKWYKIKQNKIIGLKKETIGSKARVYNPHKRRRMKLLFIECACIWHS